MSAFSRLAHPPLDERSVIWRPDLSMNTLGEWRPWGFTFLSAASDTLIEAVRIDGPHVGDYGYWRSPETLGAPDEVVGINPMTGQVWAGKIETDRNGRPMWRSTRPGSPPCRIGLQPEPLGWSRELAVWRWASDNDRQVSGERRKFSTFTFEPPPGWQTMYCEDAPL